MNIEELRQVVKKGESATLEFKESAARGAERDRIGQELCSFACTTGGTLLIGVGDDKEIVGIKDAPRVQEQLLSQIYDSTDPPLAPEVELIQLDAEKAVIRLKVEGDPENVYTYKGVAYTRANDRSVRMGQQEYQKRVRQHHPRSWEVVPVEGATEEDIDSEAVEEYITRYKEWNRTKLYLSAKELLLTRGCATKKGKKLQPTRVGIILFGKDPRRFFMKAYVTVVRFPGLEIGDEILDMRDLSGPLMYIIDNATDYLREHRGTLRRPAVGKPTTETLSQYPDWSLRELIVNAVVHRDYAVAGGRVLIQMFKDRIEFRSPGGFPVGVTADNALSAQRTRNPTIARMLHDLGYIEEFGDGLNRVFREIREHPLEAPAPKIEEVAGDVVVTIYSPVEFLTAVKKAPELALNETQQKVVDYVKKNGTITRAEYMQLAGVSSATATRHLKDLMDNGVLIARGKGRGLHYVLAVG